MIVTGCNPWTLYKETGYMGDSVCLFPADSDNCDPSFFETAGDLEGFANSVQSVRRGCFGTRSLKGKNVPKGEVQKVGFV